MISYNPRVTFLKSTKRLVGYGISDQMTKLFCLRVNTPLTTETPD